MTIIIKLIKLDILKNRVGTINHTIEYQLVYSN